MNPQTEVFDQATELIFTGNGQLTKDNLRNAIYTVITKNYHQTTTLTQPWETLSVNKTALKNTMYLTTRYLRDKRYDVLVEDYFSEEDNIKDVFDRRGENNV
ncbi:uncharacterized protein METZ01_LOCUS60725 [marine metagenome]|uniref:Uncharacterized protein n=1 Tax=marine metagenome TaxID=408172 RepID=A0A381SX31_9ZZZZ|tara:strand:+ start:13696 stop:14001 length:306 start_codon:yes stop_codon:yes gene_type:complete